MIQRILQWTLLVVSGGFNALLLLGIAISASEYRPSGAEYFQQGLASLVVVSLCTVLSLFLVIRPSHSSLLGYAGVLVGLVLALTLAFRESWLWDPVAKGLALAAAASIGTSIVVVARSLALARIHERG